MNFSLTSAILLASSLLLLSGCSQAPSDGRSGDGFTTPLQEVLDAMEAGDGPTLCEHLNSITRGSCAQLVSSSGVDIDGLPVARVTPEGEQFAFDTAGFFLTIDRTDIDIDGEIERFWSVSDFAPRELELPLGGSAGAAAILPGEALLLMPGAVSLSDFAFNVDSGGLWTPSLDTVSETTSSLPYGQSPTFETVAQELLTEACEQSLSELSIETLLDDPSKPQFLQAGQSDDAKGIDFRYADREVFLTRTINTPVLSTPGSCDVEVTKAEFPSVTGEASVDLVVTGDVDRQTGRSRGVVQYEFLPRVFNGTFTFEFELSTAPSGDNGVSATSVGQVGHWVINESIPDVEFFGGRSSG